MKPNMRIELHYIPIRDLIEGYKDSQDEGVVAYGGRLDVRPKYQREFVYPDDKRNAVIETILKGFPLNVMYWVKKEDGNFEILDGQQRTISICRYAAEGIVPFSIKQPNGDPLYFHMLSQKRSKDFLDYELMVYFCEGDDDDEKLEWFKIVNIAGEKLSDQELRNALFTGDWLTSAKKYFSRKNEGAHALAAPYVSCKVDRQELLELALKWISHDNIKQYMADHHLEKNAVPLWTYFQKVIAWVQRTFPTYRREMKGLPWGELYNEYGSEDNEYDSEYFEQKISELMQDDEVTKKSGIYQYLLTGKEKYLNLRTFSDSMKRTAYERQNGLCAECGKPFAIEDMEGDHHKPWCEGGKTEIDNLRMLCRECNRNKGAK